MSISRNRLQAGALRRALFHFHDPLFHGRSLLRRQEGPFIGSAAVDRARCRHHHFSSCYAFAETSREIDSQERLPGFGASSSTWGLAALLAILRSALFVYLSYTVISRL
jgi:hypothetical protein